MENNEEKYPGIKCGIIEATDCCANCTHCQGLSYCTKHRCSTYPGAICSKYETSDAKANRKLKDCEKANKRLTISAWEYAEDITKPEVTLGEISIYMPKTTLERVKKAFSNYGLDLGATLRYQNWWSTVVLLNGQEKRLYDITGDEAKIVNAMVEYFYDKAVKYFEQDGESVI